MALSQRDRLADGRERDVKILLVGKGSREHAIAWKLSQSPTLDALIVAPGNGGTGQIAENVPVDTTDLDGLLRLAQERSVDLTVVGPDDPLADGIVDLFKSAGLSIFGPTKAAARIESSKSFAKELMMRAGVPTGGAETFDDYEKARGYVESAPTPVVIKADGLAAGKGVTVAETTEDALAALHQAMVEKQFGPSGERVLVEEYLEGRELSVFAFVDGERISPLEGACDYQRVGDGDTGPNTGGMGSYSPPDDDVWNDALEHEARTRIIEPVVASLSEEGNPYQGVLYAGLILTVDGLKVIEFNSRMGDPEAQVMLPRLKTDLLEVMAGIAQGNLSSMSLDWDPRACVGVVMASEGYPVGYQTGFQINNLDRVDEGVVLFHAGTKTVADGGSGPATLVTDGGRVLTVTAIGDTLEDARRAAYANASRISFTGSFYRADIASLPVKA